MRAKPGTLRVGIVGAGANTRARHIPEFQGIPGVEIVSVANRRRASAEQVARDFGIAKVYDAWEALVRAPDSDAILIGTWPYLHAPVTLAALEAGKHVLCEARMAMNAAEARQMLAAAQRHPQLVAQVVPSPFTLPVDAAIQRLLREGYLGQLNAVEIRATDGAFPDAAAPLHWRQDFDLSGFNVMTLGIWYEALVRWIGTATQVVARGKCCVAARRDPLSGLMKTIRIPDHLVVLADMACGALATLTFSAVAGGVKVNEAVLFGSDGTLRFSDGGLSGIRRGEKEFAPIPIPPHERGRWRVEEEFVAAIRGEGRVALTTFEDGVKYMDFTEAVARSMAETRPVSLPLP